MHIACRGIKLNAKVLKRIIPHKSINGIRSETEDMKFSTILDAYILD